MEPERLEEKLIVEPKAKETRILRIDIRPYAPHTADYTLAHEVDAFFKRLGFNSYILES